MTIRKFVIQGAVAALLGAGAIAVSASSASAYVVCNDHGDCWHTDYNNYAPNLGLSIHDDHWRWGDRDHYRWHEHAGRGYWRNGLWITL